MAYESLAKTALFVGLYFFALFKFLQNPLVKRPSGLRGARTFIFYDPDSPTPDKPHGVVAFVMDSGHSTEDLGEDLFGPFGYSSHIDKNGIHLYGRDTWGPANQRQIEQNHALWQLARENPGRVILLAGVRKLRGHHIFPLNVARWYTIPYKVTK
jgi:hypothetical protein